MDLLLRGFNSTVDPEDDKGRVFLLKRRCEGFYPNNWRPAQQMQNDSR